MRKSIVLVGLCLVIALGACAPKVPISCGDNILEVPLSKAEEYKKACGNIATEEVAQQPVNCQPAAVQAAPESVVKEPEKVVIAASTCSYDYSVMPTGLDEKGRPLADRGIIYSGNIVGPALVQLNSLTAVAVFPGKNYNVPSGEGVRTWQYIGDEACLRSQFQFFPGKTIDLIN